MRDPEFIKLRNTFFIVLGIIILFVIPIFFFIKNKLLPDDPEIFKRINKKEDIVLLVVSDDCKKCNKYSKYLEKNGIKYTKINRDRQRMYEKIIRKIQISNDDIISPTLIYVKEGIFYSSLVDIKNEKELTSFVENYELNK